MTLDEANQILERAYVEGETATADAMERIVQAMSTGAHASNDDIMTMIAAHDRYAAKPLFVYGWNRPGFMPDMVSDEAMSWSEARDALLWEVQRWDVGGFGETEAQLDSAASTIAAARAGAEIEIPCGTHVLFVLKAA